jgi:parallel beta-helix repeat protein
MSNKKICGMMLALLLMGIVAFNVQQAKTLTEIDRVIYIKEDGSIVYIDSFGDEEQLPPEGPVTTVDNVTYTLTDNIKCSGVDYETGYIIGIVVKRNNIIIDGQNYMLECVSATVIYAPKGIYLYGINNVTIKNVNIKGFYCGIHIEGSTVVHASNNTISENTITNNSFGITLTRCSYNNITGNNIINNDFGISLETHSDYNSIIGNNIENSKQTGMYIKDCSNNLIYRNNFINNTLQVHIADSENIWDNGTCGNYWSDYTGYDKDGDGYGDEPYVIDEYNKDNHPIWSIGGGPLRISMELIVAIVVIVVAVAVGATFYIKRKRKKA